MIYTKLYNTWNVMQRYFRLAIASAKGIGFPEMPWLPLKRIILASEMSLPKSGAE
jgi:hypothetical protein